MTSHDASPGPPRRRETLPLYGVVFVGFLGYAAMIAVFTPMLLRNNGGRLAESSSTAQRTIVLGVLLSMYPLGQFLGSPVLGALSDRIGRRPILLGSLDRDDRLVRRDRPRVPDREPPAPAGRVL